MPDKKNKRLEKVWRWTNERAFYVSGQGQHSIKTPTSTATAVMKILPALLRR
jgi:hypothetical protein